MDGANSNSRGMAPSLAWPPGVNAFERECLTGGLAVKLDGPLRKAGDALAAAWSRMLKTPVRCRCLGTRLVHQPHAAVWRLGAVVRCQTPHPWALRLGRELLAPLLDRQLGATAASPDRSVAWTPLERALLRRLCRVGVDALVAEWGGDPVLEDQWTLLSSDDIAEGESQASTVSELQIQVLGVEAALELEISTQLVQQLAPEADARWEVHAVAAEVELPVEELAQLKVGDVLVTDTDAGVPAQLHAKGQVVATGTLGQHAGRKAIRLL